MDAWSKPSCLQIRATLDSSRRCKLCWRRKHQSSQFSPSTRLNGTCRVGTPTFHSLYIFQWETDYQPCVPSRFSCRHTLTYVPMNGSLRTFLTISFEGAHWGCAVGRQFLVLTRPTDCLAYVQAPIMHPFGRQKPWTRDTSEYHQICSVSLHFDLRLWLITFSFPRNLHKGVS